MLLGSNQGHRALYIKEAAEWLRAGGFNVSAASDLYETEPVECGPQAPYLNRVLLGTANVPAALLLALCQGVEGQLGRSHREPHGPRTLDVDLLWLGSVVLSTARLTLPHPAIPRRKSILVPLADVAPGWMHPLLGKSVRELLAECRDPGWVRRWGQ